MAGPVPCDANVTVTSTDTVWNLIATELRSAVGSDLYEIWLAPLRLEAIDESVVTLTAPQATRAWVADRFTGVLARSASKALGQRVEVRITAETRRSGPAETGPTAAGTQAAGEARMPARAPSPKYTFEQFVIGPANRFAHGAALSVAENPGVAYNPLFICGPPGVGKTHLLHAIASYARSHAGGRVLLTNAEDFASAFVAAIRTRRMDEFKAHHRQVDMILVDDVQYLMDKARTEEEFFHTFNSLSESGAQIVLASDRPPAQLERIEDRLRDRFGSGLVAPVGRPDGLTRLAALRKRASLDGIGEIDESVLAVLAGDDSHPNIRALEASLIRAVAFASLSGRPLTAELAEEVARDLGGEPLAPSGRRARHSSIAEVVGVVSGHFGIGADRLAGSGRTAEVAWARQVTMFLCRQHTRASTSSIGGDFGDRTHSAVIYACRRVEERMASEPGADREVRMLSAKLSAGQVGVSGDRNG